jgi:hypothetical protein
MCGNDISTIPIPGQDFIDLVEPQIAKGTIKIGTIKHNLSK